MKLYHTFVVDDDDDWDDNLFVVDDNSKKRKRVDEWEQKRIDWELQSCCSLDGKNEKEKIGCR